MKHLRHILLIVLIVGTMQPAWAQKAASKPAPAAASTQPAETWVAVLNFETIGRQKGNSQVLVDQKAGAQLADSVRLKLRRQKGYKVLDRLSTEELCPKPIGQTANPAAIAKLMKEGLGVHIAIYGTLQQIEGNYRAELKVLDLRPAAEKRLTPLVFTDSTQRARAVIAGGVIEAVTDKALWVPPEYGDEAEPTAKQLGKPINANGNFTQGSAGWDKPDGLSTFLIAGPKDRGNILKVRTDIPRNLWLAWRRKLRLGQAAALKPPTYKPDRSYGCVGGLEGVHYRSQFIPAAPGQRYWLTADLNPTNGAGSGAKVFIKGFKHTPFALDGLPESSLENLGLTPKQFAQLTPAKRKTLILADRKKNPTRYLRECYRWYLACRGPKDKWTHHAAPFPPRGGLPKDVEFLQIQIYSYWPPGTYLWDNVHLYRDPRQTAPLKEATPRTPNYGKTSDIVEAQSKKETP